MTTATEQKPRNLTPHELAGIVRVFRDTRGWSQEQLAEISGLSARTVQRVEEGAPSSVDTRRALASAFGFEDIDAFNKPYGIPTAEEAAAAKERFEKEHMTLKAARVESGKALATLAAGANAWMFSEGVHLSGAAEEAFASLSDYCKDFADCSELYSATDRLAVHEEMDGYLATLASEGVCLVAATRAAVLRAEPPAAGVRMDIVYVVAFPKDAVPESFAVQRQVRFG
ncbi:helix-turn-helix domain-containing protein [Ramlibacter alkalitolerans]|uniref:Helix-turn-helix transcriptional regulator n=1 Tax=Ramlibacter alkalitolerans TaxID=2039631 RepID=A0ABS1K015_9BURK|nr:helix-turn-helix domain-containing protein [Ramlibacter alkalitolerans]MBL0428745.1 helix-turn-helix transcriptional regulator [Ramlibacter alkalitolerans]